jgi:hypothetical protein
MPDLRESAEQFAKDMAAMNIAGLMMAFTPNGMMKAMAMQTQMQTAGAAPQAATGFEVNVGGQEGELHLVDILLKNADGEATIFTKWQDVAGAWKVEDIGIRT